MQREIKFRGKRVDGGGWVYGSLITNLWQKSELTNTPFKPVVEIVVVPENDYYDCFSDLEDAGYVVEVIPETVGQLVKQTDRQNYYEGDILGDTLPLTNDVDYDSCYVVTWDNFHDIQPTEIYIGNIHDNNIPTTK